MMRILCALLLVVCVSSASAQRHDGPVAKHSIEPELGVKWDMTSSQLIEHLKMREAKPTIGLSKLVHPKGVKHELFDTVSYIYNDSLGLHFLRIDYAYKTSGLLEHFKQRIGEPNEISFARYHWVDSAGRWINLFAPRGKQQRHWIAIISKSPYRIGDLQAFREGK